MTVIGEHLAHRAVDRLADALEIEVILAPPEGLFDPASNSFTGDLREQDHAALAKAFRRWAGVSPSRFRKIQQLDL